MTSAPFPLPLTPYERFMWRNDRPGYPVIWSLWTTLRGEIDERLLDQALAETIAWHPLLSAVIAGRGRKVGDAGKHAVHRVAWTENSRAPIDPIDLSREPELRLVAGKQGDEVGLVLHFNHSSRTAWGGSSFWATCSARTPSSLPASQPGRTSAGARFAIAGHTRETVVWFPASAVRPRLGGFGLARKGARVSAFGACPRFRALEEKRSGCRGSIPSSRATARR